MMLGRDGLWRFDTIIRVGYRLVDSRTLTKTRVDFAQNEQVKKKKSQPWAWAITLRKMATSGQRVFKFETVGYTKK